MLFDTPVYFLFLALVVIIYWRLGHSRQNLFLLAASYFFYGWWDWRFLLLMAGSTVVDYVIARRLANSPDPRRRRALLILSLVLNFGVLAVFKYFDFFASSLASTLTLLGASPLTFHFLQILLPPGISFYTFQEVAYMVDVYRGKQAPASSLTVYALFISLFPHLIAGPIQRPGHLLPQIEHERDLDPRAFFDGCMLIVSGLFRKCVVANQCAILANAAFDGRFGHNFLATCFGAYAFSWQIYGDFSGYSDIARGSAQLLGFHFMVNFRQPYLATSLRDFWRRWHISLSTWLRDYLYIPLGGNQHGRLDTYRNLLLTMLLGGLWHGANATFVLWGGLHGAGLSAERALSRKSPFRAPLWIRRLFIFSAVCLAWIFFRATSIPRAFELLAGLSHWEWRSSFPSVAILLTAFSGALLLLDLRLENANEEYVLQHSSETTRIAAALVLLLAVLVFSASQASDFIYFRF